MFGPGAKTRGFTLIEMVVVIALMLILLSIALPMFSQAIVRAREAKFHSNVATLNKVIETYSLDKKKAPQSLDDLIQAGYLKYIPDDITGRTDTWVTEPEDPQHAWNPDEPGIGSVHSGSNETASDGTVYSTWTH